MPYFGLSRVDVAEAGDIEGGPMSKWFVKKRCLAAIVLAAGVIGALTATAVAQSQRFPDVAVDHYAYEAVEWAAEVGVTTGYTDGTFKPQRPLSKRHAVVFMERYYDEILGADESADFTRGDMMVLLKAINDGTLRGTDTPGDPAPDANGAAQSQRFPDVAPDHYAFEAVGWAAEVGVTTGYTDGTFKPQRPLSKRHAVVFMERYYDKILGAEESDDFTRGDMMVLLKAMNDGTIRNTETESDATPPRANAAAHGLAGIGRRYLDVAVGPEHACAIGTDHSITCWGNNEFGKSDPPDGSYRVVAAASDATCAIGLDDSLVCWGRTSAPEGNFRDISAMHKHLCALPFTGAAVCWGIDDEGQASPPVGTFTAIAAGSRHACALTSTGTAVCWGIDDEGQASPPAGTVTFTAIAAGGRHSCGVRSDRTVTCWGSNAQVQSDAPDGEFESVVAGSSHSCALATDSEIVCWGEPGDHATWKPSGRFAKVAAGAQHNCALRTDETIVCWGFRYQRYAIVARSPSSTWSEVTVRGAMRCVRRLDGVIACWEQEANLLNGSALRVFRDATVSTHDALNRAATDANSPSVFYREIHTNQNLSCGLKSDHTATCWGVPAYGRLDVPTGEFKSLAVGRMHSCGLRQDGSVECWGISRGEATIQQNKRSRSLWISGLGPLSDYEGQFEVPDGRYTSISAGGYHTCGIKTNRTIACWGSVSEAPSGRYLEVAAAGDDTCAIREDRTVACWGRLLGRSDLPSAEFTKLSVGYAAACGITVVAAIVCWSSSSGPGISGYERLTFLNSPSGVFKQVRTNGGGACAIRGDDSLLCWSLYGRPEYENISGRFSAVSEGIGSHRCVARLDGSVTCWGDNGYGALEIPFESESTSPASTASKSDDGQIPLPSKEQTAITAGEEFTCALRQDRTIACWGGAIAHKAPTQESWSGWHRSRGFYPGIPEGQFSAVSGGRRHACGIRLDRTVTCWGANYNGELEAPPGEFAVVSSGHTHNCGVKTDGSIACWGAFGYGGRSDILEAPPGEYLTVSAGYYYSCGIRADQSIVCWGSLIEREQSVLDAPAGAFTAVSVSPLHACGLRVRGSIECWGKEEPPNQADSTVATIVNWGQLDVPPGRYISVDVSSQYSCGLRTDGVTVCWGSGIENGRIARDFVAIAVGHAHLCGLRADNTVDCVGFRGCSGFNDAGQFDAPSEIFRS